MNVMLDTNVVLDVLKKRQPFWEKSKEVMDLAERKTITAALTASTITDIYYVLQRHLSDHKRTKSALLTLAGFLEIVDVTRKNCLDAFDQPVADYEDALLVECAKGWGAEYIITRNIRDFGNSPITAVTPDDFLAALRTR